MKKLVLALTAIAALAGSRFGGRSRGPSLHQGLHDGAGVTAGPASTSSAVLAADCGTPTRRSGTRLPAPISWASIRSRAATAGSVPLVLVTTGSSVVHGSPVFSADGQFGSLRGTIQDQFNTTAGQEKLKDTWAAGARVGYLVAPNVLSYVNGGYTGSSWSGTTLVDTGDGRRVRAFTPTGFDRGGWFVGGGVEN